jgi:pimeloyl-ACP methyl ester carboxylesterase
MDAMFILMVGMGCYDSPEMVEAIRRDLRANAPPGVGVVKVVCDSDEDQKMKDATSRAVGFMPSMNNKYMSVMTDTVREEIARRKVVIAAHSHGGMQASRIAQLLADDPNVANLHVATFGSIWTPVVPGVDLVHYMIMDDIALKCNHASRPRKLGFDPATRMHWLASGLAPTNRWSLFDRTRWGIHNSYNGFVIKLLQENPDVVATWKPVPDGKELGANEQGPLFLYMLGFGCSVFWTTPEMKQMRLSKHAPEGVEVRVVCDDREDQKMVNIAARTCALEPPIRTAFELRMTDVVRDEIARRKVVLVGHSHGGLQVSRIAMTLASDPHIKNLHVVTFGSIWTPRVPGVDILHVMLQDDMALKCNHAPRSGRLGLDESTGLYWIASGKPPTTRFTILDMTRWVIHMAYRDVVTELLQAMPDVAAAWKPRPAAMAPRTVTMSVGEKVSSHKSDVRVRVHDALDYRLTAERTSVSPSEAVRFPALGSPFAHAFLNAAANCPALRDHLLRASTNVDTVAVAREVRTVIESGVAQPIYLDTRYAGECGEANAAVNALERRYGLPMTMASPPVETRRGGAQHDAVAALMNVGDLAIVHTADAATMSVLKTGGRALHAMTVTKKGPPDVEKYSGADRVGLIAVYNGSACVGSVCYFRDEYDEDFVVTETGVVAGHKWVSALKAGSAKVSFATTSIMIGSYKKFAHDSDGLMNAANVKALAGRDDSSDRTDNSVRLDARAAERLHEAKDEKRRLVHFADDIQDAFAVYAQEIGDVDDIVDESVEIDKINTLAEA